MIPPVEEILRGYSFVARRWQRGEFCNREAVAGALETASLLAEGDPDAEPAALFHAFAENRRAFPFAWRLMAGILAKAHADRLGFSFDASRDELDALCLDILHRRTTFPSVLAWFRGRTHPVPKLPPAT